MNDTNWKIWDKDETVELRTFHRTLRKLPEMECAKQLSSLIANIYQKNMTILDVGCASGHYYHSLKNLDIDLIYKGIDSTVKYIEFAKEYFVNNNNVSFDIIDIYNLDKELNQKFDIVFCCNVILHLPTFQKPLVNLINASNKYIFVRTLISDKTHLSKFLHEDDFDQNDKPINFCYQNTYSRSSIEEFINSNKDFNNKIEIEFIEDKYIAENINIEYNNYNELQNAVTNVSNNIQIAGSKVFEWEWLKIKKVG